MALDLYSLHASIEAVLAYLEKVDPDAERRARHRYACFEDCAEDPQDYGYAATLGLSPSCEDEVTIQLQELGAGRWSTRTAMGALQPTSTSSPSRTHGWSATPSSTIGPCSAAAWSPGTCAIRT